MSDKQIARTVEQLKRAQARREKRLQNMRTVYGYRTPDGLCDNLILMPTSCEMAHKEYLRRNLLNVLAEIGDDVKQFENCDVVRIGRFDKTTCELRKGRVEKLFSVAELIKDVKESKK